MNLSKIPHKKLLLFGSALRGEWNEESDIDLLVEFEEGHVPSFIQLHAMEEKLSQYFLGRKVDLRTANELRRYFRDEVIENAVIYMEKPDVVRIIHIIDVAKDIIDFTTKKPINHTLSIQLQ